MPVLSGFVDVEQELRRRAIGVDPLVSGVVGFSASYAIHVHENLEARHTNGQAKFLEEPARTEGPAIAGVIANAMRSGATFMQAVYMGCLYLQRAAQKLVPVLTGNLKGSAFSRVTRG